MGKFLRFYLPIHFINHCNRLYLDNLHACCCMSHSRGFTETPSGIIKDKMQTRKLHEIETAILISPFKYALNSNLNIFSTDCSPNSETKFIIYSINVCFSFVSIEISLTRLFDCSHD